MYRIKTFNKISPIGLTRMDPEHYEISDSHQQEDGILVRSAKLLDYDFPESLLAISRAGTGVNNIPLDRCSEAGIAVFNTPGANANAVKELVLCAMLMGSRDVPGSIQWVKDQAQSGVEVSTVVEKGKSAFVGPELYHKSLGVIGLGAIGALVCNIALSMGMDVYGCDPFISIDAAWRLDSNIVHVKTRDEIYENSDIITLHVPLLDDTKKMINREAIAKMKDGVIILNFARDLLVDDEAMEEALKSGKVKRYITDFPNDKTAGMAGVVAIPHLGASTEESEDNCAKMAVRQVMNFLENGNIVNSVNYPNCDMGICSKEGRITIMHRNIPGILTKFTGAMAMESINISDMLNKSRGDYAYTMLDLDGKPSSHAVEVLKKIDGVLRVRVIR